jgi:hypothetical protein
MVKLEAVHPAPFSHHLTAMARTSITQPLKIAIERHIDFTHKVVFEIGKGKSKDSEYLAENYAAETYCYDPHFFHLLPKTEKERKTPYFGFASPEGAADIVLLIFVLNILPIMERTIMAQLAMDLVKEKGTIIVGVRHDTEAIQPTWKSYQDGYITTSHTFQHFYPISPETALTFSKAELQTLFPGCKIKHLGKSCWKVVKGVKVVKSPATAEPAPIFPHKKVHQTLYFRPEYLPTSPLSAEFKSRIEAELLKHHPANLIKADPVGESFSLLLYSDWTHTHPYLLESAAFKPSAPPTYRKASTANPPILHRCEHYFPPQSDLHKYHAIITRAEQIAGLFHPKINHLIGSSEYTAQFLKNSEIFNSLTIYQQLSTIANIKRVGNEV